MRGLIDEALRARLNSYSPYSGYSVGAALLDKEGNIYTGCNVENASYGASICAERVAFTKAISQGAREFVAIAIVGGRDEKIEDYAYPCGICRQFMAEFCDEDFKVICYMDEDNVKEISLGNLLPEAFAL